MSYEKQTWQTGDTITAEKLNHIEDGIAGGGVLLVGFDEQTMALDKTWQQIADAALAVIHADTGDGHTETMLCTEIIAGNTYIVIFGETAFVCDDPDDYPQYDGGGDVDPTITT